MSVHNESLDLHKPTDRTEDLPNLEYRAVSHDSLSMFLAAVGGAILGVLLTLLILAIVNGGTLSYAQGSEMNALQQTVTRVDQNVGTLSSNVDVIAAEVAQIRTGLASAETSLRSAVSSQSVQVEGVTEQMAQVNEALATLEQTRQRFDTFVTSLTKALAEVSAEPATTTAP